MTSRSSGSDVGYSISASLLPVIAVAGAVCVGGGDDESMVGSSGFCCHNVLSSMQMMSSAFMGVDVTVTGTVGEGPEFFNIGEGGGGK